MKPLIALVAAAMIADLVTFALVVPLVGIGVEMNPVMRIGYERAGIAFVACLKAAATVLILLLVYRLQPGRRRVIGASLGIFIGLVGVFGNVTTWMVAS